MTRPLDELIDLDDLDPEERRRLERMHELLEQAGPPADLPEALMTAPEPPHTEHENVIPLRPRRQRGLRVALVAAAVVAVSFASGYLVGNRGDDGLEATRVVTIKGKSNASGSIRIGSEEASGDRKIELAVDGLPRQGDGDAYYELFLERDGKPTLPCGSFRMHDDSIEIEFSIPHEIGENDRWVVTKVEPPAIQWPGEVVMETV